MALAEHALTTFEEVACDLGLDGKSQVSIERIINAVSTAMQNAAGGRFFHREVARVERKRGYGHFQLVMQSAPIVSITSITLNDIDDSVISTFDSGTYIVDISDTGIIYRSGGWVWTAGGRDDIRISPMPGTERANIVVTYVAGYITRFQASSEHTGGSLGTQNLPEDLEEACIWSVVSAYRRRSGDRNIEAQSNNDVNTSYRKTAMPGLLLPETEAVAQQYRRSLVA